MTARPAVDAASWNAAITAAAGRLCSYCGMGVAHSPDGAHHDMWAWTGPNGESFRPDRRRRQQGTPAYLPCPAAAIRTLLKEGAADDT